MKTPDAIKKGLACCSKCSLEACEQCPYEKECDSFESGNIYRDASAYITQLEARVPKWISVKDRLPEDDDDVLIFSNERVIFVGCYKNGQWISYSLYAIYGNVVTHWMPLPSTEGLK